MAGTRARNNDAVAARGTAGSERSSQVFWQDSCSPADSYYFEEHGDVPLRPATTIETMGRAAVVVWPPGKK